MAAVPPRNPLRNLYPLSVLRPLLDHVPVAMAIVDRAGRILGLNAQAQRSLGYGSEELTSQPIEALVPERLRPDPSVRRRDGLLVPAHVRLDAIETDEGPMVLWTMLDVTDRLRREASERQLRTTDAALEHAQKMARLGHIVTGKEGIFEEYSASIPEMLGIAPEMVPASTREWLEWVHPEDRARFRETAINAAVTLEPTHVEYRVRAADGEWLNVRQLMEPIPPNGNDAARWFCTLQDVTHQKRAEEQVRNLAALMERRVKERTAELEAANRELAAFDYSVTHDLGAPLRHIQGFARLLKQGHASTLQPEALGYLERIVAASERMKNLIEDLFKLSTTSRAQLTRTEVDISALARAVFNLLAKSSDREIELVVQEGLTAQADRGLTQVVLENLIGNAWKFTAGLAVPRIEVGLSLEGAFVVRDNGVGFDMADAGKLFEPFRRLHPASQFEGSGIGLATVRRIVDRHGGRVWAKSIPGKGTSIYFTLG
jgi:PAS domain S-box-containing protein